MDFAIEQMIRYHAPFGAIVDIDGTFNPKTGRFWQVDDAIDAGHKSIFIREGTYAGFTVDVDEIWLLGESYDVVVDGGVASHAISVTGDNVVIENLQAKTTAGGGQVINGINLATCLRGNIIRVYVSESDNHGIATSGANAAYHNIKDCRMDNIDEQGITLGSAFTDISGNEITNTGSFGIGLDGTSTDVVIRGNRIDTTGDDGILLSAANGVVDGNRITNWTNEAIDDDSGGTVVVGDNDTT